MSVLESLQCLFDNGLPENQIKALAEELLEQDGLEYCNDIKPLLLVSEFGVEALDAGQCAYDDCMFSIGRAEYLVLDESEKETRWDDCLESFLDDGCIEGADSPYFDREAWKRDARYDGAGHALSGYDGSEIECTVGKEWYYIYRVN